MAHLPCFCPRILNTREGCENFVFNNTPGGEVTMADGYALEALVNLHTLFHSQPLATAGISVQVEGWERRLLITGLQPNPPDIPPKTLVGE